MATAGGIRALALVLVYSDGTLKFLAILNVGGPRGRVVMAANL